MPPALKQTATACRPLGLHPNSPGPRLYDRLVAELRARGLGSTTEQIYIGWIKCYLQFHDHQHPGQLNQRHLAAFLRSLTEDKTDNRRRQDALAAVLFLYRHVLPDSFPWLTAFEPKHAKPKTAETPGRGGCGRPAQQALLDSRKSNVRADILDQVRRAIRVRNLARSTEKSYVNWVDRFLRFHRNRHPLEMGKTEVSDFLTHLAVDGNVAASTQNQALAALLFLYRDVLERDFGWLDDVVRAKKPKRLPTVFTAREAEAIIAELTGVRWLMGMLIYGGGLRVAECLRSRVKDLDFERLENTVRDAKGAKDRVTLLPKAVVDPLQEHLDHVRQAHEQAIQAGYAGVELPYALARSIPTLNSSGAGSTSFPRHVPPRTRAAAPIGGATCIPLSFRMPCVMPSASLGSPNTPVVIPFGTRSPPSCWLTVPTSGLSRNCWVITTFGPLRFTRM